MSPNRRIFIEWGALICAAMILTLLVPFALWMIFESGDVTGSSALAMMALTGGVIYAADHAA